MSDADYITPAEVRPGMHVEIVQRPWYGVITAPLVQGRFTATEDDRDDEVGYLDTSWSVDAIGSIRRLPDPLPTTPGTHLVAKVTRYLPDGTYPETDVVVIVVDSDPDGVITYRSTTPVRGFYIHAADEIRSWKILDIPDPDVTP